MCVACLFRVYHLWVLPTSPLSFLRTQRKDLKEKKRWFGLTSDSVSCNPTVVNDAQLPASLKASTGYSWTSLPAPPNSVLWQRQKKAQRFKGVRKTQVSWLSLQASFHFSLLKNKLSLLYPFTNTNGHYLLILRSGMEDPFKYQQVTQLWHLRHHSHETRRLLWKLCCQDRVSFPSPFLFVVVALVSGQ